jgi:hypothetical protein
MRSFVVKCLALDDAVVGDSTARRLEASFGITAAVGGSLGCVESSCCRAVENKAGKDRFLIVDVQTFTVKQPVGPTPPLWALRGFSARGKVLIAKS